MTEEELAQLYRKEGTRYHPVDEATIIGQAFEIMAKRGMGDIVSQTIRRLFVLTGTPIKEEGKDE